MARHLEERDIRIRRTRTHRSIRLNNTAGHAAEETSSRRVNTHRNRRSLDLGRGEEEDGTLC